MYKLKAGSVPFTVIQGFAVPLLAVVFALVGPVTARADDFCALTLRVTGPMGEPSRSTWIELDDASGRVVWRDAMQGPDLKICDFGFGPHTLRVGTNECLPVAISNLRVVFGFPLSLHVILDGCGYREQMRKGCLVYLRTVGTDGQPLPGVNFSPPIVRGDPQRTDGFGRWQSLFGGEHDLTFSKPGFAPVAVHVRCNDNEEVDQEIVMPKAAP